MTDPNDKNLLDHDFDGIQELDNQLPPWWVNLFLLTVVFSVVYFSGYHVLNVFDLQEEEYNAEITQAKRDYPDFYGIEEESNNGLVLASVAGADAPKKETFATDMKSCVTGGKLYKMYCFACHGTTGGGSVGPNLTDKYWINGGSYEDIIKVITHGVPEKGMVAWGKQLKKKQIKQLTAFIYSLQGTFPKPAKEPQGEIYEYKSE